MVVVLVITVTGYDKANTPFECYISLIAQMMCFMEETIVLISFNSISFAFIAIMLLATYGINEIATKIAKKKLPRYFKSLVSLIVGIATMVLYLYKLDASLETVLLSFLICTFGYDLIIKPILKAIKRHLLILKSI